MSRPLVLTVAGASKLVFIGLVITHGTQYLGQQLGIAIGVDLVMILLFIVYLVRWSQYQNANRKIS